MNHIPAQSCLGITLAIDLWRQSCNSWGSSWSVDLSVTAGTSQGFDPCCKKGLKSHCQRIQFTDARQQESCVLWSSREPKWPNGLEHRAPGKQGTKAVWGQLVESRVKNHQYTWNPILAKAADNSGPSVGGQNKFTTSKKITRLGMQASGTPEAF